MKFELPDIILKAIGSERSVALKRLGYPSVLLFHDQNTLEAARTLNEAVRDVYPEASTLLVASIVDLGDVPEILHIVVKSFLLMAYEESIRTMPLDRDPADYAVILPDWSGKTAQALQIDTKPVVAVIDSGGAVVGKYKGSQVGLAALQMLDEIMYSEE